MMSVIAMSRGNTIRTYGTSARPKMDCIGSFGAFSSGLGKESKNRIHLFIGQIFSEYERSSLYRVATWRRFYVVPNISTVHYRKIIFLIISFPFPPLPEQRAIAHVLTDNPRSKIHPATRACLRARTQSGVDGLPLFIRHKGRTPQADQNWRDS